MSVLDTGQEQFLCGGSTVAELAGEIDIATTEETYELLVSLLDDGCVIVDLSAVEFIDASGVNALVKAAREASLAHRHLTLAAPPRQLSRILDVLALHQILPTHPDVDTARSIHSRLQQGRGGHYIPPQVV